VKGILDTSKTNKWLVTTEEVAKKIVPATTLRRIQKIDPDEMYCDTMSFLVEELNKEVGDIVTEFESYFLKQYSHIRAFHACRPLLGLGSYRLNGIKKLSRDLLRELAHAAFHEHRSKDIIDQIVDEYDIPTHEKSVYLFTDDFNAQHSSQNHYLQSGSEMLQALLLELNLGEQGILASQATPCLIECHVPIEHISLGLKAELWRSLVTIFFKVSAGKPKPQKPFDFCIRVTKKVEPESIVKFHLLKDSDLKYTLPYH